MSATVLQLSDTHFTLDSTGTVSGYEPDARLDAVLAAWDGVGERLDAVVLTGDNTDAGAPAAYARLAHAVGRLGVPSLVIAGNHDDPAAQAAVFGDDVVLEVGEWCIVGLHSSVVGEIAGTVDVSEAIARIDAVGDRPTIVAVHHPPVSRSTHAWFQLRNGQDLLVELGERQNVRALITGHLHDAFELEGPRGIALLGCPSTLMAIGHVGDVYTIGADAPTGARILRLHDDGSLSSSVLVA